MLGFFDKRPAAPDVLVVDDEEAVRELACAALSEAGLSTAEAADGRAAFAEAKRLRPRLILLDVDMPGYTGLMTLEGLKADPDTRAIPVLMVTARKMTTDVDAALRRGAAGYITKPYDLRLLLKKAAEYVKLPRQP